MKAKSGEMRRGRYMSKSTKRLIFYCLVVALPVLQFCVFYVGVNINSILLAFSKHFIRPEGGYKIEYFAAGFDNFKKAFEMVKQIDGTRLLTNSLSMIGCEVLIGLPLAVIFSFYIYKRFPFARVFKVVLFMPQIVSVMVFSILFKYVTNDLWSKLFDVDGGLLNNVNENISFGTILFYNVWISFGVNVIMFSGSMSSIDPSLSEACQLDGASILQEFWYVTLPMIWPTFTTFVIVSLTGLFVHQMNLFSLFSANASTRVSSFGYQLYVAGQSAGLNSVAMVGALKLNYYELSALGLSFTMITLPIVLFMRWGMRKIGPSVN